MCYPYFNYMDLYRWVVLYNANLDRSVNRKTTVELKKDLKRWEEERPKKKKPVVSDVLGYQVNKYIILLIFCLLTKVHSQITHKTEFSRLVNAARQTTTGKMTPISISSNLAEGSNPPIRSPWIMVSVTVLLRVRDYPQAPGPRRRS